MTNNKVCSYCKQSHGLFGETVCPVENTGLFSVAKESYFALDISVKQISTPHRKFIPPNPEATEYFKSIWGFGGTQNKL